MINNAGYNNFLTAQQFQVEEFYNAATNANRNNFARTTNAILAASQQHGLIAATTPQMTVLAHQVNQQQQQQQQPHQQQQLSTNQQHLLQQTTTSLQQNGAASGIVIVTNIDLAKYNELVANWKDYRLNHLKHDLDVFTKQLEAHKIQQFDLNNKLTSIQATLFSSLNDKTGSCHNLLMSFQSCLNNLSNRITTTENLVTKLATFFMNLSDLTNGSTSALDLSLDHQSQQIMNNSSSSSSAEQQSSKLKTLVQQQNQVADFAYLRASNEIDNEASNQSPYTPPYDLSTMEIPDETTAEIAKKVREYLQISKISQRKFAETLLNMKQANFSSLLSQPLAWPQLSKTYKDRFLIMYAWLNDPFRMDKLDSSSTTKNILKIEKNKQLPTLAATTSQQLLQQAKMRLDENNKKRTRICLSNDQTNKLKVNFIKNPYPSANEMDEISVDADVEVKKVAAWFAHQRQVYKIQNKRKKF